LRVGEAGGGVAGPRRRTTAAAAEVAEGGLNGAPGLGFERGKALREEGKEGKLTKGSKGREERWWRRSSGEGRRWQWCSAAAALSLVGMLSSMTLH
jgi:hypothetical protein